MRLRHPVLYDVWHDSFMCATWLIHMCDITPSHIQVTYALATREDCYDMTSYVWHDSFMCTTWLIHTSDKTQSYIHVIYTLATREGCYDVEKQSTFLLCGIWYSDKWYIHSRKTRRLLRHDVICVTWLIHVYDVTYFYEWHNTLIYTSAIRCTGWLRLVGSLKL